MATAQRLSNVYALKIKANVWGKESTTFLDLRHLAVVEVIGDGIVHLYVDGLTKTLVAKLDDDQINELITTWESYIVTTEGRAK